MLTKLFVVLLVLLSLMLTAGTVVFVGQVQDYKKNYESEKLERETAVRRAETARSDAEAAQRISQEQRADLGRQIQDSRSQINALNQEKIDKDTQLAAEKQRGATMSIENMTLAAGVKSAQDAQSQLQSQITDLRTTNDRIVSQNAQLNQRVTELGSQLEVTERERKLLAEQLAEAKNQVTRQAAIMRDNGVPLAQIESNAPRAMAPAINGVIREVRPIQGVMYASISVGSADNVARGMEFKVVSRETGKFLGILTVDTVELNESTGRLRGEALNEIRQGSEVKTQF